MFARIQQDSVCSALVPLGFRHILAQYDLETRRGIFKFATFGHVEHSLKEEIEAVAEVLFEGRHCLAVSHRG